MKTLSQIEAELSKQIPSLNSQHLVVIKQFYRQAFTELLAQVKLEKKPDPPAGVDDQLYYGTGMYNEAIDQYESLKQNLLY